MSTKATVILLVSLFLIGIILIVVLPLLLRDRPAAPEPEEGKPPAGIDQGVFRSDDGGRTWQTRDAIMGGGSISTFRINQLFADPTEPGLLYLLTNGNGLFRTFDRGEEWRPVRDEGGGLDQTANVLAIAINPAN